MGRAVTDTVERAFAGTLGRAFIKVTEVGRAFADTLGSEVTDVSWTAGARESREEEGADEGAAVEEDADVDATGTADSVGDALTSTAVSGEDPCKVDASEGRVPLERAAP